MPITDPCRPHCSLHNPNGEHDVVRGICTRCGLGRFNAAPHASITAGNAAVEQMERHMRLSSVEGPLRPFVVDRNRVMPRAIGVGTSIQDEAKALRGQDVLASMRLPEPNPTVDREADDAYRYLCRLFAHVAPQCTPLPDLMGVCTQIDNYIAGFKMDDGQGDVVSRVEYLEMKAYGDSKIDKLNYSLEMRDAAIKQTIVQREEARTEADFQTSEVTRLKAEAMRLSRIAGVLAAQEQPGNIDYIGPTKPDPDKPGRRLPVPDAVHEQVHRVVGDVLAGRVIQEARRQLQEALKSAPKEKASLPTNATTMQIGLRLP